MRGAGPGENIETPLSENNGKIKKLLLLTGGAFILVSVAILDYVTGPEVSSSIFYFLPLIYFGWFFGSGYGFLIAGISAVLWFLSDVYSGSDYSHPLIPYWNAVMRLCIFLFVSYFLVRLEADLKRQREMNKMLTQANEKIQKLANVKSEFASMVSHELRTPLTVIKESMEIIYKGMAGPVTPDQKDFLETGKRNVDRLHRLITNVLSFQKLESGSEEMQLAHADLNKLLREAHHSFEPVAKSKDLNLVIQLDETLPEIEIDPNKITQVIYNFVNNALKFCDQGSICLKTENLGSTVRTSVVDEGPGIRSEDLHKLFESFSQISDGPKRKPGGTGLGLAISKKIVEMHRGKVGVDSQWGKGSTFYFTLPLKYAGES